MAHAGLAKTFAAVGFFGFEPAKDVWPQAKEIALTALEIDDNIAVGHTALAQVLCFYEWDWEGAEREHRRAIAARSI